MIFKKNIYFLNNKIISCDTIVLIAQEVKIKIITLKLFFMFLIKTYNIIKKIKTCTQFYL